MIILQRLHAENFKGLRAVDLTFPERGSILIEGHNEAGKSTIFEAVYLALYGEPLVGEDSRARLEEVIQHGQPQALVELRFAVGVNELTVERVLRRGQPQRARLTIRRPDGTVDSIGRVSAVNRRVLDELNHLDGDNLRNSCFVEQKELGRLEDMEPNKREQAIQKLLGLERLTKLSEQFKFRSEQERELQRAQRLLDLAHAQAKSQAVVAEERELAERLAAATIVGHLAQHAAWESEQAVMQRQLADWEEQELALRARLTQGEQAHAQLDACRDADLQVDKAGAQRETVERLHDQLGRLDIVEQTTLPKARAQRANVESLLALVVVADQQREAVRNANTTVQDAQRAVEALQQAEALACQRAEALTEARDRADQHRQEAQAARERTQLQLRHLEAQRTRLGLASERVTTWERNREELDAAQADVREAVEQAHALAELRATLQRQEVVVQQTAQAATDAERVRQQAEARLREAEGRVALQEWVRLKEVEARLSGFMQDRSRLENERRHAEEARAAAQVRARTPLYAAVGATLLALLALMVGAMWTWAFALGGALAFVAVALWVSYGRARAALTARSAAANAADSQLRDMTLQYQAAVHAGGDPALLKQRERELHAAGVAVPSSLAAAHDVLRQRTTSDASDVRQARDVSDAAVATAARLAAEAEQAQALLEQTQRALRDLEATGDTGAQLQSLLEREAAQRQAVDAAAVAAQQAVGTDMPWPTSSATAQAALAACGASQAATQQALTDQETTSAASEREDMAAIAQAEQARESAEDAAAALRASDPQVQLDAARTALAHAVGAARDADAQAQRAAQPLHLATERAVVEAERGRAEERLRGLTQEVAARPALASDLAKEQAAYATLLQAIAVALAATIQAARLLAPELVTSLATTEGADLDEESLTKALSEVRAALESRLAELDEPGAKRDLEQAVHEKATLGQRLQSLGAQVANAETSICDLLTARGLPLPAAYTPADLAGAWPLTLRVSAGERDQLDAQHDQARERLVAARDRERHLSEELEHSGAQLDVEECKRHVLELEEERDICQRALRLIQEVRDRIARQVLPTTERNMQLLLPELTAHRYVDVLLRPPDGEEGQLTQLDYRIRVWDQTAGRYVAKNLFSGGTRDQCSLALRLAFALATLPQELGVAPGFIFLDEPLSAFDAQRAQALVDLLTTGVIAQQFAQIVVISHHHAFDRDAFRYHVRMEGGQVIQSDLPGMQEPAPQRTSAHLVATATSSS
jgi:DNA repair exonuclease SbcCD ATPase subunit